jgi:hypothetical protein
MGRWLIARFDLGCMILILIYYSLLCDLLESLHLHRFPVIGVIPSIVVTLPAISNCLGFLVLFTVPPLLALS